MEIVTSISMETLSLPILKLRDSFLEKFANLTHEKLSLKLKELLETEKDEVTRIVILASRVEIIRKRIEQINPILTSSNKNVKNDSSTINEIPEELKQPEEPANEEDWIKVIINETTEVNGVRFPEGIQIDVTKQDSERLVNSGKASLIK
tara:strand:+ start:278 stop:727 length:450 start_codon:yes stop_codon:yes gene_type:complete